MFAIAFDLVVADTERHHPKGVSQAYTDVAEALKRFEFRRIQGSVYVTESEDLSNLFEAIMALNCRGSPRRCATFAHSGSSSGRTLRP